jgi:hypothetical protein
MPRLHAAPMLPTVLTGQHGRRLGRLVMPADGTVQCSQHGSWSRSEPGPMGYRQVRRWAGTECGRIGGPRVRPGPGRPGGFVRRRARRRTRWGQMVVLLLGSCRTTTTRESGPEQIAGTLDGLAHPVLAGVDTRVAAGTGVTCRRHPRADGLRRSGLAAQTVRVMGCVRARHELVLPLRNQC